MAKSFLKLKSEVPADLKMLVTMIRKDVFEYERYKGNNKIYRKFPIRVTPLLDDVQLEVGHYISYRGYKITIDYRTQIIEINKENE